MEQEPLRYLTCRQHDWLAPYLKGKLQKDTVVEAIEAFRSWRVDPNDSYLHSQFYTCAWAPYRKMEAICMSGEYCCAGSCDAGIYATKGPILDFLANVAPSGDSYCILGKVWLWGRILECEDGYRAEFAYPSLIYNTHARSAEFAQRYGVPLLLRPPFASPDEPEFLPSGVLLHKPMNWTPQ